MRRASALMAGLAVAWLAAIGLRAATSTPVIYQSAPGHFEVAAIEAAAGEAVAAHAEEGWRLLAGPLGLPDSFSTPVFVRIVPADEWHEPAPFRVIVEAGGVVSVRVRWSKETTDVFLRRALVQALLMRLAVSQHGVTENIAAPLWLEIGSVVWWQTHAEPAQFDALKQESARFAPPALADLLGWQRGENEPRSLGIGALWLFTWLQTESTRANEWPAMLHRLLGGETGGAALAATFPGRFANEAERELWWQTGWHHLRRVRVLPALESADSRAELASLGRFVFARDGHDQVMLLAGVLAHAREPLAEAELQHRANELARLVPALHPFYRNAGLSLAEVFHAGSAAPAGQAARIAAFEQDWRDAVELDAASATALDALERHGHNP